MEKSKSEDEATSGFRLKRRDFISAFVGGAAGIAGSLIFGEGKAPFANGRIRPQVNENDGDMRGDEEVEAHCKNVYSDVNGAISDQTDGGGENIPYTQEELEALTDKLIELQASVGQLRRRL